METKTVTLTAFLLERIAEDEAHWRRHDYARDCQECAVLSDHEPGPTIARMLAECEAKRRIVELHDFADEDGAWPVYERALRALAAVYVDHEAWREEWRP